MSRRTAPQHKVDDIAFPVRVKVRIPECGFGTLLAQIYTWLDREIGRGEYAHHPATAIGMDATAFYFQNPEAATQFVSAFDLKLVDGTDGHLISRRTLRQLRAKAMNEWREVAAS
jgi:hypothetical protein